MAKAKIVSDPVPVIATRILSEDGLVAIGNGKVTPDVTQQYALPGEGMRRFSLKQTADGIVYMVEVLEDDTEPVVDTGSYADNYDAFVVANGAWAE